MRCALLLLALPGCAVGAGGSVVGQWRARRVVESTACIETAPGVCGKVIEIGSDQPARSFGGGVFAFSVPGYAQARTAGMVEHAFVLGGSYEYLRGRSNFALGGRIDLSLTAASGHSWIAMPVLAVGHAGAAWGSVFVGLGYAPLLTERHTGAATTSLHDGVAALAGTRIILRGDALARHITVSPELHYQRAGAATILSLTADLGLHF